MINAFYVAANAGNSVRSCCLVSSLNKAVSLSIISSTDAATSRSVAFRRETGLSVNFIPIEELES